MVLAIGAFALAGCNIGEYQFTEVEGRGGWRAEKERACMATRELSDSIVQVDAIVEEIECGMDFPLEVSALSSSTVVVSPKATIGCPLTDKLEDWIAGSVQPAAQSKFGSKVVEIKQISAYACRKRNNFGKEFSEHAFGNALDIAGFKLANGREFSIAGGWKGDAQEQAFLREVFAGACERFTTTLGPGSNILHYNHIHMDLAQLAPDGSPKMCKPPPQGGVPAVAATPAPTPAAADGATPPVTAEPEIIPADTATPGAD
ncbi:extensin family protein [Bauldia sp.]|uniref:extensin-like domain-containing protein n=1 Tax=Bauldia sp. TaxID=2575872 RepID=UPI003BAA9F6E